MATDWDIIGDDEPAAAAGAAETDALDGRRIHAIVLERRTAHRAQLRRVLVPIGCAAVALMAIAGTIRPGEKPAGGRLAVAAIAASAIWIGLRAIRRQADIPTAPVTTPPLPPLPTFDTLPDVRPMAERLAELNR